MVKVAVELGVIILIVLLRVADLLPFPAWPFLLVIAAVFRVAPWNDRNRLADWDSKTKRLVIAAVFVGVVYQFFTIFVEGPLLAWLFGEPETLPQIDGLVGNIGGLIGFLLLVTVFSIGEELAFRGYLLERLNVWFGKSIAGTTLALILASISFGVVHTWQNLPGVTGTIISGVVFGCAYLFSGRDVRVAAVVHWSVNVTAVVLGYFGLFLT